MRSVCGGRIVDGGIGGGGDVVTVVGGRDSFNYPIIKHDHIYYPPHTYIVILYSASIYLLGLS